MVQSARPASDIATTGWTATPLWEKLNEASADDASLVVNAGTNPGESFEVKLANLSWPRTGTQTLKVRVRKTTANSELVTVSLKQGSALIATRNARPSGSFDELTLTVSSDANALSPGQLAVITDYTDLRVCVAMAIATPCCPGVLLPATLYAHWSTTDPGLNGLVIPLVYGSPYTYWIGYQLTMLECTTSEYGASVTLSCDPDTQKWRIGLFASTEGLGVVNLTPTSCEPFHLTASGTGVKCGNPITINITETP